MGKAKAVNAESSDKIQTEVVTPGATESVFTESGLSDAQKEEIAKKDARIKELESLLAAQSTGTPSKAGGVKTKNGKYLVKHQVKIAETGKIYTREEIAQDEEVQKYLLSVKSAVLEPVK